MTQRKRKGPVAFSFPDSKAEVHSNASPRTKERVGKAALESSFRAKGIKIDPCKLTKLPDENLMAFCYEDKDEPLCQQLQGRLPLHQLQASQRNDAQKEEHTVSESLARIGSLEAENKRLKDKDELRAGQMSKLERDMARMTKMMHFNNTVLHADTAAMKVRAMRDVGTRLALRHVGYTEALVGEKKMRKLLENWDNTWRKILSKREQKIIEKRFGSDFVTFLLVDRTNADINHANTRAYTINQNMSWAERAFLIQAIEAAQTPEVRAGAAAVYAFWFGCASLEADKQVVQAKLAE